MTSSPSVKSTKVWLSPTVPEGVVEMLRIMDRRNQGHVVSVDRITLEYIPVEPCHRLELIVGALSRCIGRASRIGYRRAWKRRVVVTIIDMGRRQHMRARRRPPRQRQAERRLGKRVVLHAQGAEMGADLGRMEQTLPHRVWQPRIGGEVRQDVLRYDEAAAGHLRNPSLSNQTF